MIISTKTKRMTTKTILNLIALLLFISNMAIAQQTSAEFPSRKLSGLSGPYLGQIPPGKTPELFAESIFNSSYERFHSMICFSPDGSEAYWQAQIKTNPEEDKKVAGIFMSKIENGQWTTPSLASFSIPNNNDDAVAISPDGKKLYFLSTRPDGSGEKNGDEKIWCVDKTINRWSEPKPLSSIINSMRLIHWGISVDKDYNLYFGVRPTMDLRDGYNGDIYCSRFINGQYSQPEKLPATVNIPGYKFSPYISPDGNYILFTHIGNKDDYYKIMVSFLDKNGNWAEAKEVNERIELGKVNMINPYMTPDGKYFFFSQLINGRFPRPYWIDAKIIDELR
jgi:hypothetical protein